MTRTFFLWLAVAALGCAGPESSSKEPLTCAAVAPSACAVEPPPRYAEIAGIVQARCVSCHDGADPLGPWPLTTYDDVADWNDIIRDELVACTMPPADSGMTIPDEERQALLMWLRCGFLE